ncbi:CHAT domain-containing protein [Kocuria sp. M4R2S49]|uniref:CHAT domain-containing protein n=1 Tax=Kocuria rhizosphaericola TaxID=3376284 RepID=UPI0037A0229E
MDVDRHLKSIHPVEDVMSDVGHRQLALVRISEIRSAAYESFQRMFDHNGRLLPERCEDYLARGREHLKATISYEDTWPGSFDVQTVAVPLVQQLYMCGDYAEAAGHPTKAKALREEADQLAEAHFSGAAMASFKRTKALVSAGAGRFNDALMGLHESYHAFSTANRKVDAAQTLVQTANLYEWLNDYDRALSTLEEANGLVAEHLVNGPPTPEAVAAALEQQLDDIFRGGTATVGEDALGTRRLYYEVLQGRARMNYKLGDYDTAWAEFEEARPFVDEYAPGGVDFHLAAIAMRTGDLQVAETLLNEVAPLFSHGLMRPRRGALCLLQADLAVKRRDFDDALARTAEGLTDQDTYPDLDLSWRLHWRRAIAFRGRGSSDEALAEFRLAAIAADTMRLAPMGYTLDTAFVRDKLPMMEQALDHALNVGDARAAVWFMEMVKARALSAVLSHPARQGLSEDAEAAEFDQISHRIDALSFAMHMKEATADQVRARTTLLENRRSILERIRLRDPRWRTVTEPPEVDVAATSAALGASDRVALVFYMRDNRVVSALLGAHGVIAGERQIDDETTDALSVYVSNLHRLDPDHYLNDLSLELDLSLDDLLSEEVRDALTSHTKILVVPHGVLHLLPWSTMSFHGRRLLETAAVGVVPNLTVLTRLDDAHVTNPSVALIGDPVYDQRSLYKPLEQAGEELLELEHLYGNRVVAPTLRGAEATATALEKLLTHPKAADAVLHVTCHGDLDAEEPLASGLILTSSKLDAGELMGRRCDFPEVVLSACSTGWRPHSAHGVDLSGDDALGLTASFLEAGARSVLVSITQAKEDVARQFMVTWHQKRLQGDTPLLAYQKTQQLMLDADPENVWSWAGITAYSTE